MKRIAVVVGGTVSGEARAAALGGTRPRIDVVELERTLPAVLHDHAAIGRRAGPLSRALAATARRLGLGGFSLAVQALGSARDADAIYLTGEDLGIPVALMARLLRVRSPRLVMRLENIHQGRSLFRQALFTVLLRAALRRIDLVLCRNRVAEQTLISAYGVPPAKLRRAVEPVDPAFFDPALPAGPAPALPEAPFIASAGLEMRDYPTLVEAARGLKARVLIGAGSPWSHFRFPDAHGSALPPNLTVAAFGPGQMREIYRAASFVVVPVLPTLRTCGISVLLEAWAMEKAVVVTRTAGLEEFLVPEVNALVAEPLSASDLRRQIERLLADPQLCARLGRAGRETALRDHRLEGYLSAVRDAVNGSSRG
jgi:glycosyltransferase involved in cell wall biosynthesis